MTVLRHSARLFIAALVLFAAGCTFTVASDTPPPIEPVPPSYKPAVEHTVADFTFVLGGGDPATRIFDGRLLSNEIMEVWQQRGYVRSQEYVDDGVFTGTADYHLTLRGSQHGDTSWTMQILNALTLSLLPYTVTENYEFLYDLDDVLSGARYTATVKAQDKTWVEPLLIVALPWADRGHQKTMQRVADHLYEQFRSQGAFSRIAADSAIAAPPE